MHTPPDAKRFDTLAAPHLPLLRSVAYSIVRDQDLVDDLVQEALIRAYNAFERFDQTRPIHPWLCQIVRNLCIDELRRRRRERAAMSDLKLIQQVQRRDLNEADRLLVCAQLPGTLKQAMARLPPAQRSVVMLVDVLGLSYHEAAETLGCPIGTLMSRLHRARLKLQGALAPLAETLGIQGRRRSRHCSRGRPRAIAA